VKSTSSKKVGGCTSSTKPNVASRNPKRRNTRSITKPHARVEHVFEAMGGKLIRSIGLARAEFSEVPFSFKKGL